MSAPGEPLSARLTALQVRHTGPREDNEILIDASVAIAEAGAAQRAVQLRGQIPTPAVAHVVSFITDPLTRDRLTVVHQLRRRGPHLSST